MTPIKEQQTTHLIARDYQRFLALLDDESAEPNQALVAAVDRYKTSNPNTKGDNGNSTKLTNDGDQ